MRPARAAATNVVSVSVVATAVLLAVPSSAVVARSELAPGHLASVTVAPAPISAPRPQPPIEVHARKVTVYTPGRFTPLVKAVTTEQAMLRFRVTCRAPKTVASAAIAYCRVRRSAKGVIEVKVLGLRTVRVTVFFRADPLPDYAGQWRANTWKGDWVLRPRA